MKTNLKNYLLGTKLSLKHENILGTVLTLNKKSFIMKHLKIMIIYHLYYLLILELEE
jgi:hypothetical protein